MVSQGHLPDILVDAQNSRLMDKNYFLKLFNDLKAVSVNCNQSVYIKSK